MSKVYVGLSGGVDSSVTAALLKEQGHEVVGVYMKNWTKNLPGFKCPWADDLRDAKRIAVQLNIPFEVFDFEQEYFDKVVRYMLDEFEAGLTPNPDIICNQEIKFKLFCETALEKGADFIATGHYARVKSDPNNQESRLLKAVDSKKDQTYFLYRVSGESLSKTMFPLGELTKTEVRARAEQMGLVTAAKKDSVGICFVGEIGIKDFLKNYVEFSEGPVIDQKGKEVGRHEGAIFYTIGQRQGLNIGGGLPYYVTSKDMKTNTVFVTSDISDRKLWSSEIKLASAHWINSSPEVGKTYDVRLRHLGELSEATVISLDENSLAISFAEPIRAITPGQSAVFYGGEVVLGGGVVV